MRSFAKSSEELWLDVWTNPLKVEVRIEDPARFLDELEPPIARRGQDGYVDCLFRHADADRATVVYTSTRFKRALLHGVRA